MAVKSKNAAADKSAETAPIVAIKGFDPDWRCHGGSTPFQYAVGQTYEHKGAVVACKSGFHAVEYPLDVFAYYAPIDSDGRANRFALVEVSGEIARHGEDSKVAAARLTVKAEIGIPDIISRAAKWVMDRCEPANQAHADGDQKASSATGDRSASSATGDSSASSATGDRSASSATGYRSASSATGDRSASSATGYSSASSATGDSSASSATGYRSASSATGDSSASSATGDSSASSATGDRSASSATGYRSASSATGDRSASSATGDRSASSATGDRSASSATGDRSASLVTGFGSSASIEPAADGKDLHAVAIAAGRHCRARAPAGSWIVVACRNDDGEILHLKTAKVGENGIEPNVFYRLDETGAFVAEGK